MDLTQAHADLQRRDAGAKFYVPSYYKGACSWDYCSWWTKFNTPYLSQSVEKVRQTTTNKKELLRETVYIINHLRPLGEFIPGAVEILEVMSDSCTNEKPLVSSSEKGKTKVKALSDQDLTCSSESARIEDKLNNLSNKASNLKVKEQEVLREAEWIHKIYQPGNYLPPQCENEDDGEHGGHDH
ncbi:hypothetical protein Cgig2_003898 [Carnegiea gigantea]|uniref:Uncharacterized protein n=1 Tax=Carnegiea gigantea TaxID=171969 RepID=A0A9Q1GSQ9_9CARY|nr:hypothetical protein Cgig2_003898 [Carnegiea gigantea]